jgi:protein-S-isoprenylcysteine O-methyltransferase Ste14
MSLRDSFEQSGRWLFRWRSYLPLLLLLLVLYQMETFRHPGGRHVMDVGWELGCIIMALLGLAIRVHVVGSAAPGTSGRTTRAPRAEALSTTGLYSIVRHPLYLGNYLMYLGVVLLPRALWLVVIFNLAFWLYYERIMYAEEEFLRRRFGADFEEWASRVPAFVPALRLWKPAARPFSWKGALASEHTGLFALIATFTLLEVAGDIASGEGITLDPGWSIAFGATALLYLTVSILKKRTHLLDRNRSAEQGESEGCGPAPRR